MQHRPAGILDRVAAGPVLGDGGYLFELERRGYVHAGPYTPEVAIESPEALTFYGSDEKLGEGLAAQAARINRAGVRIARSAAGDAAWVASVVTLSPSFRPGDPSCHRKVRRALAQQVEWQCEEGVDLCIGETFVHLQEAPLAVPVLRTAGCPSW